MEKIIWAYRVRNEGAFHRVEEETNILAKYKEGELTLLVTFS
jgi:hypothetical protein